MGKRDGLDLYAGRGWPPLVASAVAVALIAGLAAYSWMTTSTPVSIDAAVDAFRAGEASSDTAPRSSHERNSKKATGKGRSAKLVVPGKSPADQSRERGASAPQDAAPSGDDDATEQEVEAPNPPREGVYSWDTDGYEEAAGLRRDLPKQSQSVVTHDSPAGWTIHHYFSEEREFWTTFRYEKDGANISRQRNKVTFGPVTEDSTIVFSPPVLVGPSELKVGAKWHDTWEGATFGAYRGKVFEHGEMDVGGRSVDVWGIEVAFELDGEQRGEVVAKVWLAPSHGLTVREDWYQDVTTDSGNYHAEWTMTLKSLKPRT